MEDEALRQARRWLEAMANGLGHKLEALTLGGLRIGSISKGLICCDFVVPNHLSDGDGNWHVGAMATLLDDLGAAAVFSVTGRVKASIDFNVSYYSTAKIQAKILAEDGSVDDTTGVGELCIKSPSLFKGYWKLPEVTKESFTDDGFFKTGDAVRVDEDGYYIILGRTNADIMKVGGYKLSALEIEATLLEHPVISECCVLGLPDKAYGEAVCAIIVPEAEAKRKREEELKPALSLEELCTWAKEKLAPYKIPTRLFVWNSLPRNAMGKVNKKELKKLLVAEGQ